MYACTVTAVETGLSFLVLKRPEQAAYTLNTHQDKGRRPQ